MRGGDGVRERAVGGLLVADAPAPVRRPLAPAPLPLQLRLHAGGGRRRALKLQQSAGQTRPVTSHICVLE